jgi:hypothetical protein
MSKQDDNNQDVTYIVQPFDPYLDQSINSSTLTKSAAAPSKKKAQIVPTTEGTTQVDPAQNYHAYQQHKLALQQQQQANQNDTSYIDQQPNDPIDPDIDDITKSKSKSKARASFSPDIEEGGIESTDHPVQGKKRKSKRKSLMSQMSMRSFYSYYTENTIEPTANFKDGIFDCFKNL